MGRGEYPRKNAKISTEDLLQLRLVDLKKLKYLASGQSNVLHWTRNGKKIVSIMCTVTDGSIIFTYAIRDENNNLIPVNKTIYFTLTPCNYGGHRKWFCCRCGRRVAVMFIYRQTIACRHCFNAVYASQREDAILRYWRKIYKLEDKLKDNNCRPKGMHMKTFKRINDEWARLNVEREILFELECSRRFSNNDI